jgi:hypothetical protein
MEGNTIISRKSEALGAIISTSPPATFHELRRESSIIAAC